MKKTFLLKPMLLLFAMIVGVGSVWGQDADVTYDFTGSEWTVSNGTLSNGTVSFTGSGSGSFKMNGGYFMLGKSGAYINFPIYSSPVEKIVVTGRSGASGSVVQNIYVGDVAVSTATTGATGTNTYEIASDYQAAGTQYTLKVTSNHNTQITKIEVFYASSTPSTEWTVTYDANGATSGSVPVDATVYDADNYTVTVLGNTGNLAKEHYSFNGWNTKADGTGTGYVEGDEFEISQSTTLFAVWNGNTHTVTLPADDTYGSYSMNVESPVAYGTEVTLTYTPASGYENYQATWSVNGTTLEGNTFTMPDENVTVTVAVAEVLDYATLPFSWAGGTKADLVAVQGVSAYGLGGDYAESNAPYLVKLDGNGDYIQIKTDSQPGKVTIGVKMIGGGNTSKITVQGSADGTTFMDVEELEISGSQNDVLTLETSNAFAATNRYVRLLFTKGSNVGVGPISIAKPSTDPAIVADDLVELEADATSGEFEYSIVNPVSGITLYASTQADWITNVTVDTEKVTFTTTANDTEEERSAEITLTYGDLTKEVTITQAAYVEATTYTLATSVTPGKHYILVGVNSNVYKAMGVQNTNNRSAVEISVNEDVASVTSDKEVYEVLIGIDNATGYYTLYDEAAEGYLYAAQGSGSGNNMKTETELDTEGNGTWTISISSDGVATIVATNPDIERNNLRYNSGNSIFSCYKSGNQKDIYLYERDNDESAEQTTIAVAPTKEYTTFARAIDLDFTNVEGIEAYVVSELTDNSAVITKVDKVAAGEGVILKKTGTAASFEIPFAESAEKVSGNKMVGVTVATDMTEVANAYILSDGLFYECSGGTLAAGKAYLVAADWAESTAPSFSIVEGGEATGIKSLTPALSQGEEVYYDLSGRRVEKPTKGVYIVNGKKVLVP